MSGKMMTTVVVMTILLGFQVGRAEMTVDMRAVSESGVGSSVGTVVISETPYGLVFTPALSGLAAGGSLHGFHIHANPDCGPAEKEGKMVAGLAAGGHYDPLDTRKHGTPWGDGHLGDLPPLYVDANGTSSNPVLAPRLKMEDVAGRSLMIHAGGDNHADHPAPLGGGGARIVCGVIKTN